MNNCKVKKNFMRKRLKTYPELYQNSMRVVV